MILYFDTFITNQPLIPVKRKDTIRSACENYRKPKKIDIARYALASYALYPWSHVLVKYELDNPGKIREFDEFILNIFPKAIIMHERSDSQKDYLGSLEILEKMKDDWIFYSPNNDHPLITSDPDFVYFIDKLINKAEKLKEKNRFVSIIYSHFSEFLNISKKGTPENLVYGRSSAFISEDDDSIVYEEKEGNFDSIQIVHKDLFQHWFTSKNLKDRRVIRAEDLRGAVKVKNQIIIAPKKELYAHFDGYEHLSGWPNEILADQVPPLFIPPGFFNKSIKIAYGYKKYRKGWVNINPKAKKYSFRDQKYGTDLKILLSDIPLFWKDRIRKLEINKNINLIEMEKAARRNYEIVLSPWSLSSRGLSIATLIFYVRLVLYRILVNLKLEEILAKILKKSGFN
ncbi:MAG: hypothetical protein A3E68_02040 [Candidatus Levybacteria bacterium RIFCSPHIGHO2_12_FULL_39_39]|nr:MAG: hypothetical protein UT20_C0036G0002 [Candidatus Levybacteria bacterium GW2011_GWA1_39_11]OGH15125.1 MAG: hypothetical protein A2689_00280 [Candidatus Levybacteria bacterium RIFCSPHIGHO2_01_FULL_38_96]OGH25881.1 MAG: hypothetical protein A3E68_02040 [Candidatus Levybacteria bacterium RIFCSPHIGHO2_12_FULL_39_39]OGH46903.1 MAG: hypothetical protein A3G66_02845 [Candidatus Levybacteria bacterium RIFCSPLOWO2_12_FULL_39_17]